MNTTNEKKDEKICNHNPDDKDTTLRRLEKRNMVFPNINEYICDICHEFFEFK